MCVCALNQVSHGCPMNVNTHPYSSPPYPPRAHTDSARRPHDRCHRRVSEACLQLCVSGDTNECDQRCLRVCVQFGWVRVDVV